MTWLWYLVIYLWVMGGLGWVYSWEASPQKPLTMGGRLIVILIWPFMALIAAFGSIKSSLFPPAAK